MILKNNDLKYYNIKNNSTLYLEDKINIIPDHEMKKSNLYKSDYDHLIDEDYTYEKYVKSFMKYNKLVKSEKDEIYSQKILNLFKNKSKSYLKTYNEDDEMKNNDENNDNINSNKDESKDKKLCCNGIQLNIENPKLIYDEVIDKRFKRDLKYESSKYGNIDAYNYPYYYYMETGDRIFEYLHGRMDNYKNPGELSL